MPNAKNKTSKIKCSMGEGPEPRNKIRTVNNAKIKTGAWDSFRKGAFIRRRITEEKSVDEDSREEPTTAAVAATKKRVSANDVRVFTMTKEERADIDKWRTRMMIGEGSEFDKAYAHEMWERIETDEVIDILELENLDDNLEDLVRDVFPCTYAMILDTMYTRICMNSYFNEVGIFGAWDCID